MFHNPTSHPRRRVGGPGRWKRAKSEHPRGVLDGTGVEIMATTLATSQAQPLTPTHEDDAHTAWCVVGEGGRGEEEEKVGNHAPSGVHNTNSSGDVVACMCPNDTNTPRRPPTV